jgi:tol-pal system protein YbgF
MFRGLSVCLLLALAALTLAPTSTQAANKEIQELQRDIAQLQDMLKQMQQVQDRQLAEIRVLAQQALQAANDTGKSVAVIQSGFQTSLREQENKVVTPVVGLGTRVDQMSSTLHELQQGMSDLLSQLSRMQTQISDINNAVKVIQAPPPPPPAGGTAAMIGGSGSAPASDTPSISATDLYNNAMRDRSSGKLDLAIQEFSDYLRWYGNTELAPNAQFHIASIHASQQEYETAVKEYDQVLEKYPDNNKTADALFGKGMALVKMGRKTDGSREFSELVKRFPSNSLSAQACTQLTSLGLRCPAPSSSVSKSAPKRGKK